MNNQMQLAFHVTSFAVVLFLLAERLTSYSYSPPLRLVTQLGTWGEPLMPFVKFASMRRRASQPLLHVAALVMHCAYFFFCCLLNIRSNVWRKTVVHRDRLFAICLALSIGLFVAFLAILLPSTPP